jgi:hypothetical protein
LRLGLLLLEVQADRKQEAKPRLELAQAASKALGSLVLVLALVLEQALVLALELEQALVLALELELEQAPMLVLMLVLVLVPRRPALPELGRPVPVWTVQALVLMQALALVQQLAWAPLALVLQLA